ncbi:hypothetical protein PR003_g32511 [Phytophthora rubi]|uniref:Uncharacterized protein n=1 Tax=Phytophthora rubi TaxID=129364 RepID=A0A6A4B1A4_9STRA|nr:hypothetical protein PR003_g32511 [Phytophthora rubi]
MKATRFEQLGIRRLSSDGSRRRRQHGKRGQRDGVLVVMGRRRQEPPKFSQLLITGYATVKYPVA